MRCVCHGTHVAVRGQLCTVASFNPPMGALDRTQASDLQGEPFYLIWKHNLKKMLIYWERSYIFLTKSFPWVFDSLQNCPQRYSVTLLKHLLQVQKQAGFIFTWTPLFGIWTSFLLLCTFTLKRVECIELSFSNELNFLSQFFSSNTPVFVGMAA